MEPNATTRVLFTRDTEVDTADPLTVAVASPRLAAGASGATGPLGGAVVVVVGATVVDGASPRASTSDELLANGGIVEVVTTDVFNGSATVEPGDEALGAIVD